MLIETWNGRFLGGAGDCKSSPKIFYQDLSNGTPPALKYMKYLDRNVDYVGHFFSIVENNLILSVREVDTTIKWLISASRGQTNIIYYKWDNKSNMFEIWNRYTLRLNPNKYVIKMKGVKIKNMLKYFVKVYSPQNLDKPADGVKDSSKIREFTFLDTFSDNIHMPGGAWKHHADFMFAEPGKPILVKLWIGAGKDRVVDQASKLRGGVRVITVEPGFTVRNSQA